MLNRLEMLIALAAEEHFGRAALSLGITQPSLSAGIKALEGELGVQLVWRGSRFSGLTPEGQRVLVWARRIVGDARTLREEMRAVRHGLSGNLRLAVIPTALTAASRLTARFGARHPNVRFTILSRTSIEILAMIENLEVDAGISYLDNEPLGRVTKIPLFRERYCLVCAEGTEFAERAEVTWEEAAGLPLCLLTPDMQNRRIINQSFQDVAKAVGGAIESNSTVVLMAHVAAGGWATILPREMAEFLGAGKPVRIVPLTEPRRSVTVGLVAPHREPLTPVLEALMAEAREVADR